MADDCSHLWHLTDDELLTHFDLTAYPQETVSWPRVHPAPIMLSWVTSALPRQRPEPALFLHKPMPMTERRLVEPVSTTISSSTLGCLTQETPSFSYKSLPQGYRTGTIGSLCLPSSLHSQPCSTSFDPADDTPLCAYFHDNKPS
jgi:hypothetical protein